MLQEIQTALEQLQQDMLKAVHLRKKLIDGLHPQQQASAQNLLHYLTLRCEDIRMLQENLHEAGLSSLASSESHTLRQLQAILERLGQNIPAANLSKCTHRVARRTIHKHAETLFGRKNNPSIPHLMVTFDTTHATNYRSVLRLLRNGMNVARINCAHDDENVWMQMVKNVKRASRETGHPCKIYVDLAGPKIRTSILGKGSDKGRVKLEKGQRVLLAENYVEFDPESVVIGCTLPGIVDQLHKDERVLFDDGKFEARVVKVSKGKATLRMLRCSTEKPRLKAEKGINFPDSKLRMSSLTDDDLAALPFVRQHADLVGYSFVRTPEDVQQLHQHLGNGNSPLLVLKIETPEAVENLPSLLLEGMKHNVFGVMIARGDLAVEIGFERLSEIQEEILWICEAAHVPVIWATQVLETLNKSGLATRSEVTDAAHASVAECVMINKGDYTLQVLETLKDIMQRSGGHHVKKRFVFRPLSLAKRFMEG
ncbi:MAG: pyruvate kinase [Saprospiraceae bacterium]|nr:pyruvate kinase [Saprospiraceae bacterium]